MTLKKADIASVINQKVGLTRKDSVEMVETILDIMKNKLVEGETVKISGFGNFIPRAKRTRKGRNPKTGEEIMISPRRSLAFRPSQVLRNKVNGKR